MQQLTRPLMLLLLMLLLAHCCCLTLNVMTNGC